MLAVLDEDLEHDDRLRQDVRSARRRCTGHGGIGISHAAVHHYLQIAAERSAWLAKQSSPQRLDKISRNLRALDCTAGHSNWLEAVELVAEFLIAFPR